METPVTHTGAQGTVALIVADANPVAYNPMPAGTTVTGAPAPPGLAVAVLGRVSGPKHELAQRALPVSYKFDDTTTSGSYHRHDHHASKVSLDQRRQRFHDWSGARLRFWDCCGLPVIVALVGLPGSGKSSVARQLARGLGWSVLDTDQVIESRIAMPIRDFFFAARRSPLSRSGVAGAAGVLGDEPSLRYWRQGGASCSAMRTEKRCGAVRRSFTCELVWKSWSGACVTTQHARCFKGWIRARSCASCMRPVIRFTARRRITSSRRIAPQ